MPERPVDASRREAEPQNLVAAPRFGIQMNVPGSAWIAVMVLIGGCAPSGLTPQSPAPHPLQRGPIVSSPVAVTPSDPGPFQDLHGSIVVKLDGSDDYVPKSGTMQVYLSPWTGDPNFVTVAIDNGTWNCTSNYNGKGLAFGKILLDGRDAYTYVDEFVQPGQREIAVEAHWLEPIRVHVVDARTGTDVNGASVRTLTTIDDVPTGTDLLAHGDGQFPLEAWKMWMFPGANKDGYEVWVEAPGYVHRIQFLNPWNGGDWTVELEPGLDH